MDKSSTDWELSKENIQPLRNGRQMNHLQMAAQLTADDRTHEKELEAIKRQYELDLRTYSGDDPLCVWYQYIKWVEQNFPKGGRDGNLIDLIQKCLLIFKDDQQYSNDSRFFDIWLKYINSIGDPLEIYQYLYSKNIFCDLAQFYIQWALQLEEEGHNIRADEVYNKGIAKIAQPIQILDIFYKQFLARITKQTSEADTVAEEDNRIALAELKQQKKGCVPHIRKGMTKSVLHVQQSQQENSSRNFQIFCEENPTSLLPPKTKVSTNPPITNDIKKENSQKPRKWCNTKISEKNEVVPIAGGHYNHQNFNIHTDLNAIQPNTNPLTVCVGTTTVFSDKKIKVDNISSDVQPARNYTEHAMYCEDKIYKGTEEFSFEEIRAARWRKKKEMNKRLNESTG